MRELTDFYRDLSDAARKNGFREADADALACDTVSLAWEKYPDGPNSGKGWWPLLRTILGNEMTNRTRERKKLFLFSDLEVPVAKDSCEESIQPASNEENLESACFHWAMATLCNKRPALARQAQAFLAGQDAESKASSHYARRTIQRVNEFFAGKKINKPGDGVEEIQKEVAKAFDDHRDLEILTLGVPFNWMGPKETLQPFYNKYYGSSMMGAFHLRFGIFFYESLLRKAALGSPVKITFVSNADDYWRRFSADTKEWCQHTAREWGFRLRDDPQRLAFLHANDLDTVAVFFACRQDCKKVLFVVRRTTAQRIDVLRPETSGKWVQELSEICRNSPELRLK